MAGEKDREARAPAEGARDPQENSGKGPIQREWIGPQATGGPASWETATWSGGIAPPRIDAGSGPLTAERAGQPMRLIRIEPTLVRGEWIDLDPSQSPFRLGRAESNEVQLFTASSSREHAMIACNREGEWMLTTMPGTSVQIDGYPAPEPVVLDTDMNIVLGEDHLRCVMNDALRADEEETEVEGESTRPVRMERAIWAVGAAVAFCVGAGVLIWFVN